MNTTHRPRASYMLGESQHLLAALAIFNLDASGDPPCSIPAPPRTPSCPRT